MKSMEYFDMRLDREQIVLQSEELFASLTKAEKEIILKVSQKGVLFPDQIEKARYVWDTGMVSGNQKRSIFSPLFNEYISKIGLPKNSSAELTKKEHLLFTYLHKRADQLCEREALVEAVWPEQSETGVSDWAIDRLVARVRAKLKVQKSHYEIVTVITRGYKLVQKQ